MAEKNYQEFNDFNPHPREGGDNSNIPVGISSA